MIWASEGFIIRQSDPSLAIPAPPLSGKPPEQWPRRDDPAIARQRGEFEEVIVLRPMETSVLVGRSTRREARRASPVAMDAHLVRPAGVMGIGLLGGFLLSNRAIRPIRAITRTARSISASNLSRRINVEDTQSELGVLARTLNDTFDRLDQSFARQIQFTADASHELRTPLTVIHSSGRTGPQPAARCRGIQADA